MHQPRTWHVRLYKPEHRTGLCTSSRLCTGLCTGVCTSPKRCRSRSPAPKLAQAFTPAPAYAHPLAQAPPLSDPLTPPAQGRAGVGVGPAPLKPAAPSSPPLPAPTDPPSPSAPPPPCPFTSPCSGSPFAAGSRPWRCCSGSAPASPSGSSWGLGIWPFGEGGCFPNPPRPPPPPPLSCWGQCRACSNLRLLKMEL